MIKMNTNVNNLVNNNNKGVDNMTMLNEKSNYKGTAKNIKCGAVRLIPTAPEQKPYVDYKVQGSVIIECDYTAEELKGKEHISDYLKSYGKGNKKYSVHQEVLAKTANLPNSKAFTTMNRNNATYQMYANKGRWRLLLNQPSMYIIATKRVSERHIGAIKFAIRNGVTVHLWDEHTNRGYDFESVCNDAMCPLYQTFKVNDIQRRAYYESVERYNTKVWDKVEYQLDPLTTKYKMEQLDSAYEKAAYAQRYRVLEVFQQNGVTGKRADYYGNIVDEAELYTKQLMTKGSLYYKIKEEVDTWARAFGILIRTEDIATDFSTFDMYNPNYKGSKYKYAGLEDKHSRRYNPEAEFDNRVYAVNKQRRIIQNNLVNIPEMLQAYFQIKYLKKDAANNIDPEYRLCPVCSRPELKLDEEVQCRHCGNFIAPVNDILLESYGDNINDIYRTKDNVEVALQYVNWITDKLSDVDDETVDHMNNIMYYATKATTEKAEPWLTITTDLDITVPDTGIQIGIAYDNAELEAAVDIED